MPLDFANHTDVKWLLDHDRTLALLRKQTAPLLLTFLFSSFKQTNSPTRSGSDLHARLNDLLFALNDGQPGTAGEPADQHYNRSAKQYIEEWVSDQLLRRYYEPNADEATYELTPAVEKAFLWLTELTQSEFVGTESRLLNIFTLLREIVQNTSVDQAERLAELEREKRRIELEINRVRAGNVETYDASRIRDRFSLLEDTAGRLLADFRQIEHNFRELNQQVRQDQVRTNLSKGRFLDDVFRAQDAILETDQGRSFTAFWEFLMNPSRQDEFQAMLGHVLALPDVQRVQQDRQLSRLKSSLIDAGSRVNRINHRLMEQLRRYVDARNYRQGRRVAELIRQIDQLAVEVQADPPTDKAFFTIDGKPDYEIVWERNLFEPPLPTRFESAELQEGSAADIAGADRLYEQVYVDTNVLTDRIRRMLRNRSQVSLPDVVAEYPIEKGLTELLVYFRIATLWERDKKAYIDESRTEAVEYATADGHTALAQLPPTIYLR